MTEPTQPASTDHRAHIDGLRVLLNRFENSREKNELLDLLHEIEHGIGELHERPGRQTPLDGGTPEETDQPSQPTTEIPAPAAPEGAVPVADANPPAEGTTPDDAAPAPAPVEADQPPGSQPAS